MSSRRAYWEDEPAPHRHTVLDPPPVLCRPCWDDLTPTMRRELQDAWQEWSTEGFGDADALTRYRAVIAKAFPHTTTPEERTIESHGGEA